MQVAVIIPCYNNAATVRVAVESALAQEGVALEVVVVDDGSTDGSVEKLAPLGDRVRVIRQENAGACVARNRGLAETTAQLVKFLDADDVLEPSCLKSQLAQAEHAGPETVVFGRGLWITPEGRKVGAYPSVPMEDGTVLSVADLITASPLTTCPLHRRELLDAIDGFDSDCPRGQEHDLHIRLGIAGARLTFHDTLCYRYIQHVGEARISARQRSRNVCAAQIEVYDRQFAMARDRGLIDYEEGALRQPFARHFWRHGRVCGRAGHDDLAARCFARSDEIAGGKGRGAVGSPPYRLLARLLGGTKIEALERLRSPQDRIG